MNQGQYSAISQGPTSIPMENYGVQPRIMPPPQSCCSSRYTKVIIAVVILTILWLGITIVVVILRLMVSTKIIQSHNSIRTYELPRSHYADIDFDD